jgi:hypothetical protein
VSRGVPDLTRELRALQEAWGLVAVTAIADTPNGQVKLTILGDSPVVAIEDEYGNTIFPDESND